MGLKIPSDKVKEMAFTLVRPKIVSAGPWVAAFLILTAIVLFFGSI